VCDIGWLAVTSNGNVSGNLFDLLAWAKLVTNRPGANTVHRHPVRPGFQGQDLGQHYDRRFGGSVGTSTGLGYQPADGADIHDSAGFLAFHLWQREPAAEHRTIDVHSRCLRPGLERMLFNEFQGMHGRVVAE
jgi:hypothetical protein